MADLVVAFDPGSTLSRAFYTAKPFNLELLLMEPEVASVRKQSIEAYERNKIGKAAPENSAWVEYEGKYRAVGFLAKNRFHANPGLQELKFEKAIYKVLALVGSIAQNKSLPARFNLGLGVFLPWGEYQDRQRFQQLLAQALANFTFRGQKFSIVLETFDCMPEGGGLITRGRRPGFSLRQQTVVVVMVGYRNASALVLCRGEMTGADTNNLGFVRLIEQVKAQTSGQEDNELTKIICQAGCKVGLKDLAPLSRSSDPGLQKEEILHIRSVITEARAEYWEMLASWLRNIAPPVIDEVILAGGTTNYLKPELTAFFGHTQINWCEHLESRIKDIFASEVAAQSLDFRLTDVYGLFFYLQRRTTNQSEGLVSA